MAASASNSNFIASCADLKVGHDGAVSLIAKALTWEEGIGCQQLTVEIYKFEERLL